ncbi:MAG: DUF92 domain-containing protein [bacterium]
MHDAIMAMAGAGALALVVSAAEGARRLLDAPGTLTRRSVHLAAGVLGALVPWLFRSRWWPAGGAAAAVLALYPSVRRGWLPALHAARPRSLGTVWFAVSALLLYLVAWEQPVLVCLPLLVLAFGDVAGSVVGSRMGTARPLPEPFRRRTWDGSFAVFVMTGLVVTVGWEALGLGGPLSAVLVGLAVAPMVTAAEALSGEGLDNLTIPLAAGLTLQIVLSDPAGQPGALLAGEALGLAVAGAAWRWRVLDAGGAAGAFLIAGFVLGGGGWPWALPLAAFFLLSSALSLLRDRLRPGTAALAEKGSRRDIGQVAANGGVPGLLFAAGVAGLPAVWIWPAFLGSVAAAAADTWGTEIGTMAGPRARLITTGERVPAGTSGGVTLAGTLGGIAGAAVVAGVGLLLPPGGTGAAGWAAGAAAAGGVAGTMADSLLGATLQGRYRCTVCGTVTERRRHCPGGPVERVRGLAGLTNDGVNLAAGAVGAGTALLILLLAG